MQDKPKLLDVVATLIPIPMERLALIENTYKHLKDLRRGMVGTVIEVYEEGSSSKDLKQENFYLVEFTDLEGNEYAVVNLRAEEILILHYDPTDS
ncbi:MAG: DUF4926 domain-containing protein [Coleofasciculaceae cyanobacterium SM2_1_6]|nr:DUF4926 domain-containing protein [Coleofasciculaceae cyanobacterium SM2_1_6]